ncbi:terminase, partial [Desulfovibrio sp. XJ01]|nr:terminase [Nitratidesulfovibrio liaohensis]
MRQYPDEIRQAARGMYLRRYTVADISDALGVPRRTVYHWSTTGEWDALLTHETAEEAVTRRLTLLAERDPKTPGELREVDLLVGTLERLQALRTKEVALARQRGQEQGNTHPGPAHQPDAAPGEYAADS